MSEAVAIASSPAPRIEHDHIVVLEGATWADYERLLVVRGERRMPRMAYLDGALQLMTTSRHHESLKSTIGCLAEAYCLEVGVEFSPYGGWTLRNRRKRGGVEPDECYVFGDHPDPSAPDLAIEVVWTHGGIDKLEIYRRLGVSEVWYWEDGVISVHALRGRRYEVVARSGFLPHIDLAQLASFLFVKPTSRAIREYRAALSGG